MHPRTWLIAVAAVTAAAALALFGGALVVWSGAYDVAADTPHSQPVYSLLRTAMEQGVRRRARHIAERPPASPGEVWRGAACFRAHCESCHGGPGVAPGPAGVAMQPLPAPLVDAARRWRPRELAWITRHGIRMSGMPAWGSRLADDEIWALVGFLQVLPGLSPAAYREQVDGEAIACPSADARTTIVGAPPARALEGGRLALQRHACHGCHSIPGVVGSQPQVGPPLAGLARRGLIAGRLPNTNENLVSWIRDPQRHDPASAMPALGVGEHDARAMAAYLVSLD